MKLLILAALCHCIWIADVSAEPFAETLQLIDTKKEYDANRYIAILQDQDRSLTIDDMNRPDIVQRYERNDGRIPNYGYTNSVYWARMQLSNNTSLRLWLLNVDQPPMDKIDLFVAGDDGIWTHKQAGDAYPFYDREVLDSTFSFRLEFNAGETKTIYLRFETEGAMMFPIKIVMPIKQAELQKQVDLLLGAFYGVLIVMCVYNTILAVSFRSMTYLYYVLINVTAVMLYSTMNGLAYQYFWPEWVWWNNRAIVFFICTAHIAALLFTRNFLRLSQRFPKINRLFSIFIVLEIVNIAVLLADYSAGLYMAAVLLVIVDFAIVSVGTVSLIKKHALASFFMIGWGVFMIGSVLTLLADAGILPQIYHIRYASQIGSVFEAIILSLGLASRIQTMRLEKEHAVMLMKQSQELAKTDYLTGLYTRRYLVNQFETIRVRAEDRPISLLLLDVDHFKRINDSYGHDAGDNVLKQFAALIGYKLQGNGIAGRYGGEEFAIFLPDHSLFAAQQAAEQLLETVRQQSFQGGTIRCTASIGVAEWNRTERETFESFVRRADMAMYNAKRLGRNRVCPASDEVVISTSSHV